MMGKKACTFTTPKVYKFRRVFPALVMEIYYFSSLHGYRAKSMELKSKLISNLRNLQVKRVY
jgi:hypothetical protein